MRIIAFHIFRMFFIPKLSWTLYKNYCNISSIFILFCCVSIFFAKNRVVYKYLKKLIMSIQYEYMYSKMINPTYIQKSALFHRHNYRGENQHHKEIFLIKVGLSSKLQIGGCVLLHSIFSEFFGFKISFNLVWRPLLYFSNIYSISMSFHNFCKEFLIKIEKIYYAYSIEKMKKWKKFYARII